MTILLPALALVFAAFCVWLTVRIVNRRERWAKWTRVAVVGLPVMYVVSFGPACWWFSTENQPGWPQYGVVVSLSTTDYKYAPRLYWPIGWVAEHGPTSLNRAIRWYATLGTKKIFLPRDSSGTSWFGA